jgi:hypothetical protein
MEPLESFIPKWSLKDWLSKLQLTDFLGVEILKGCGVSESQALRELVGSGHLEAVWDEAQPEMKKQSLEQAEAFGKQKHIEPAHVHHKCITDLENKLHGNHWLSYGDNVVYHGGLDDLVGKTFMGGDFIFLDQIKREHSESPYANVQFQWTKDKHTNIQLKTTASKELGFAMQGRTG